MCIAAMVIFSLFSSGKTASTATNVILIRNFQPLILAQLDYDFILKIETSLTLNTSHDSWGACPAEQEKDEEVQLSSVSKNAVFVKTNLNNRPTDLKEFKCVEPIQPVLVRNKFDNKILEIGFEVYFPKSMPCVIDQKQSNENIRQKNVDRTFSQISHQINTPKEILIKSAALLKRKPPSNTKKMAWVSVLLAEIDENKSKKEIRYEILNVEDSDGVITCSFEMEQDSDLIDEKYFKMKFEYNDEMDKIHPSDERRPSPYMLEFLVPKDHLVFTGKQVAACTLQNLISISTRISPSWTKTNEFILNIAKKLGRLEIIVGAIGVIKDHRPTTGSKRAISRFNGIEIPVPEILYRIVKHVVKRQRYSDDLEFGIIIIHHNISNQGKVQHPFCTSICKTNHWEIEDDSESSITYCCPVNDENLEQLGVKDELKFVQALNVNEILVIKQEYKDFDKRLVVVS